MARMQSCLPRRPMLRHDASSRSHCCTHSSRRCSSAAACDLFEPAGRKLSTGDATPALEPPVEPAPTSGPAPAPSCAPSGATTATCAVAPEPGGGVDEPPLSPVAAVVPVVTVG